MEDLNIKNDLTLVKSEYIKYSKKELLHCLQKLFIENNFIISKIEKNESIFTIVFENLDGSRLETNIIIKNITNAGWADKPHIKRIQVSNLSEQFDKNDEASLNLYIGYYCFDKNPIYVVWEPMRYVNHNTLRSCYVNVESLVRGYELGYLDTVNSSQKVWIFKKEYLEKFIKEYKQYLKNDK